MARQGYESNKQHSDFYRICFHTALRWLFVEIFIIFILISVIMYVIFSQKTPPYYATMFSGKIMRLTPMQ